MNDTTNRVRRGVLKAGAAATALGALGFPAISRGQADAIRIGHLTDCVGCPPSFTASNDYPVVAAAARMWPRT